MNTEDLFSERQRFTQWWLWLLLIGLNVLFFFGFYQQVLAGQEFGNRPTSNSGLMITTLLVVLFTVFIYICRLDTLIKRDGIYVRFFPIHIRFRHFTWDEINKVYTRKYNSIKEYGGWGIRYGFGGKGKAYNISGNIGLQIEFIDNEKLLIGTNKPEELGMVLNNLGKLSK